MSESNANPPDPSRLAGLLQDLNGSEPIWRPEELSSVFRHQMAAPIKDDLSSIDGDAALIEGAVICEGDSPLKSFADLLTHPDPPLELLRMTKEFAKARRSDSNSLIPDEIATVLYFASIAAALVRCRERITELDDDTLTDGFGWAAAQSWVDDKLATLLADGRKFLDESETKQ